MTTETTGDIELKIPDGDWPGPIPVPDIDSQFFWKGLREHKLLILRCGDCGYWIYSPLASCPQCLSFNVAPEPVSGRGTIYSFTVVHREFAQGIKPPYVAAFVDLDEQPALRLLSNIVNCRVSDVEIGMPVRVVFHDITDDVGLAFFEPVKEA